MAAVHLNPDVAKLGQRNSGNRKSPAATSHRTRVVPLCTWIVAIKVDVAAPVGLSAGRQRLVQQRFQQTPALALPCAAPLVGANP